MKHEFQTTWGRVSLVPLEGDDFESLRVLRNQESRWFKSTAEVSCEQQQEWQRRYTEKPGDYMFKIVRSADQNTFMGAVGIYDIDTRKKTGEFGRLVIDKMKPGYEKGLGLDATVAVLQIAFEQLNLKEVYLEVLSNNLAAIKTYERAGFKVLADDGSMIRMAITSDGIAENPLQSIPSTAFRAVKLLSASSASCEEAKP